jgi:hypothetical protein
LLFGPWNFSGGLSRYRGIGGWCLELFQLPFGRPAQIVYRSPHMKFKRILKWLLALFLLGAVALVFFLLSLDTIARWAVEKQIERQSGIKAKIGYFHLGLRQSSVTIKDLKLYNPPEFGGTLFLSIPEIHAEIDPEAAKKGELHLTLLRFNLGELDIVKNEAGQTNILSLGMNLPDKDKLAKDNSPEDLKKRLGYNFTGIDKTIFSFGKAKYIDLGDPKNNREQDIDIENYPVPKIQSSADLTGVIVFIYLRSDNFFEVLGSPGWK